MRNLLLRIGLVAAFWPALPCTAMAAESNVASMLGDFVSSYAPAHAETIDVCVELSIAPPGETWYVVLPADGDVKLLGEAAIAPVFTIKLSWEALSRIHAGDLTAFTAAAKASGEDTAPLEFESHQGAATLRDPKGTILGFLQHFFALGRPERILLGEEHSRVIHGAHAIPLYYASGFRSAWYRINDGEHLNEPGDTNPFPQAFIIISGRGTAKIGESEVEVKAGESYYIPPGADHVLTPAEGEWLELIWLAWGEGA